MKFLVLSAIIALGQSYIIEPGPQIKPSVGGIWPKPKTQKTLEGYFLINPKTLNFVTVNYTCDIIEKAFERYKKIISETSSSPIRDNHKYEHKESNDETGLTIETIYVNLTSPCELQPYLKMDEWYYLASRGIIVAHSVWGILRALETYSQLVIPKNDNILQIKDKIVFDEPRFPHRGLLLDTSRHFISMQNIFSILNGMAYNKMNVFHWHIVDDQSFPYESNVFPELSAEGAFLKGWTYSQKDIADVIEYGRLRGIRVLPEFDVPGHTRSWGISHPEVLTKCEGVYEGKLGPINPIEQNSYDFLEKLFREVVQVFSDDYLHLGGDEVGFECWSSNNNIKTYMLTHNISSYTELQRIFMERISKMIKGMNKSPIVWQEAMVENVEMPKGSIVQVWTGNWRKLLAKFTEDGHQVLMSECWYLDHLATGGDWEKFYRCEPHDFAGKEKQKKLVIGGEACMWGEVINNNNVISRIFPRVSAIAERLWSTRETTNNISAKKRIEEHTCRMINRGISAQPPNGPGFC